MTSQRTPGLVAILAAITVGCPSAAAAAPAIPMPADECAFIGATLPRWKADADDNDEKVRVGLLSTAKGWRFPPRPRADVREEHLRLAEPYEKVAWDVAPSTETLADMVSKTQDARLEACPGLSGRLRQMGWTLAGREEGVTSYWRASRVGFNAAHTEAVIEEELAGYKQWFRHGRVAFFRKDPKTGAWVYAGHAMEWIS